MKKLNMKNWSTEWSMDRSVKGYLSKNSALKLSGGGRGKANNHGNDRIFIKNKSNVILL